MSAIKPFFDTNVLLYLLSDDVAKAGCAEALLAQGGTLSVQVLNEFAAVASRKLGLSYPEIGVDQAVVSPAAISITAMAPWRSRPNCSGLDEAA